MAINDRVKRYRLKQKELGRLKREMYLTDSEWMEIKSKIAESRRYAVGSNKELK